MYQNRKMIVAVDFDGCVTDFPYGQEMTLQEGCRKALIEMKKMDIELILWTCRRVESLEKAILFLKREALFTLFDKINDNSEFSDYPNTRKVLADVYIDDRNVGGWIGWEKALEWVKKEHERLFKQTRINAIKITTNNDLDFSLSLASSESCVDLPTENAQKAFLACADFLESNGFEYTLENWTINIKEWLDDSDIERITNVILRCNTLCILER